MHRSDRMESKEEGMCKPVAAALFDFHRNGRGDTCKQGKKAHVRMHTPHKNASAAALKHFQMPLMTFQRKEEQPQTNRVTSPHHTSSESFWFKATKQPHQSKKTTFGRKYPF